MLTQLFQWISNLRSRMSGRDTSGRHLESLPSSAGSSGIASPTTLPKGNLSLTDHFTIDEATRSNTASSLGISNEPDEAEFDALRDTANRMEAVRALLKAPILVRSWFRNPEVNRAVGG